MSIALGQIKIHLASAADAKDFATLIHELDDSYGTPIPETIDATALILSKLVSAPRRLSRP